MDEAEALAGAVYGTPEDVITQIDILREVGIEYLIVSLDHQENLKH
jgi:fructose-1-phosphate kinase PfkB-like protein